MRMRSPAQNLRNPFMPGLPRPQSRYDHPARVRFSIQFSCQAGHTTASVPATAFSEKTPCRLAGEEGRKLGPAPLGSSHGVREPRSPRSAHPVPAQPLRGLLVHSRVHARVSDSRSWCRCRRYRCRRRHPAAATTGCRRLGHPSGGAGRGRRQRRRQRACWKWTCSSARLPEACP